MSGGARRAERRTAVFSFEMTLQNYTLGTARNRHNKHGG
jgi:hypothetical protein